MANFDKTKPLGTEAANLLDDRTRENFTALEERLAKEHQFPDNPFGVRSGRHKFGVGNTVARDAAFPVPYAGAFWGFNTDTQSPQIHTGAVWFDITKPTERVIGEVRLYTGDRFALPAGWLECRGQEISRSTYNALFVATGSGIWFGAGNGSTTFNLPDMRECVPAGLNGGDLEYDVPGRKMASPSPTRNLTIAQLPIHSHPGSSVGGVINQVGIQLDQGVTGNSSNRISGGNANPGSGTISALALLHQHSLTIAAEGANAPFDIRDPYVTLVFMIWSGVP